ncbi:MAG: PD40 domain-containing protein, partial [Acidobacteria bacterium]|nr:PD40 domain-containing protein [Acidobacteriota bacterium]
MKNIGRPLHAYRAIIDPVIDPVAIGADANGTIAVSGARAWARNSWRWIAGALVALFCFTSTKLSAQERGKLREPLPFAVALSLLEHNGRSPVDLSPNGEWVAHTIKTDETVPRDSISRFHSATAFPFAEGDSRMEATLTNTKTGEVVRLGGPNSASWAAVWSPDGSRVAFYSDEGGEAGLW